MKERKKRLRKNNLNVASVILFIVLTLYVISLLVLYAWAFGASLKTEDQFFDNKLSWPNGWPWEWAWGNYTEVLMKQIKVPGVQLPFSRYYGQPNAPVYIETMLFNSLLYTIGGTLVNNITTWVVAYMITRYRNYKISKFLFTINIALMTIPVIGNLPSALAVFDALNWRNNYWFILFNNIGFTGVYLLYYCAFIRGLGNEYYEAAYIDGAGNFTCMLKIAFPLTAQMFSVIFLLGAIARWNDYMTMLIWMPDYPTLAYGIYKATSENVIAFMPQQISACVVLMLPLLILFALFQKAIMGNLRLGALKG